ncbi:TonB-dependent receptor domain-containing protein [Biformimicrobium ophioploci]|uniref:TonB-dependent receptor n=1 Tax=Biformimicrobium ophioploci TaxID=3036711 RepID=A0ABQ6LYW1_9GAMM|nr:TonB-dependent receptor [Microbulbifer sp. NKW57]GMG87276.1 TonB-dependent receptor [Microbulbifer sp. NKW57]
MRKNLLSTAIKGALGLTAAAVLLPAMPAFAQDEAAEAVEEVVVTGSRIKKADFVSNAPVSTIGEEQFSLTGTVNTESLLNTLPQVIPGLDRTSNNPGNGTATVDLRGLGANRTLVLVNGTRMVPTTAGGVVDINQIPTALIKNVEVLTGGASAVYGTDAVAGVVNFILKDDFEGVSLSASSEMTGDSDAGVDSIDLTIGGNFADDRGNAVLNMGYTSREALFQGDRDFSTFAQFDSTDANGNPILIDGGSSGIPGTSIFSGGLAGFSPDSLGVTFDPNGDIRQFRTGETNDFYNYAPVNYIQLPQERYQFNALGHFDLTDSTQVYGRAMFTNSEVPQQLAPTPIFQTVDFTLDGNPFLSQQAQQVLSDALGSGVDTDMNGIDDTATAFVRRRLEEVGPRIAKSGFSSWQINGGIRGDIVDTNWTYDAYYQKGRVTITENQYGNVNRDRFQQALLLDLDADPNGGVCANTSSNGGTVACSPINIFGAGNISEAGAAFLRTAVASTAIFDQEVAAINLSGDTEGLIELPGGAIGLAAGFETRRDTFAFDPSQDLAAGTIAGFNGAPALEGGYSVDEFYVEAYLPILSGAPFAELVDMEVAFRSSDFNTVGSVDSYKVSGSWAPTEMVRFRAGFNTAVRAPNIGELFAPISEGFPGATDPCAGNSPDQSQAVRDLCIATGVPANAVHTAAINPASGQVRALGGGNPDLIEESAETMTVGLVVTPMDNLDISVDYFDIEIEDAVAAFGGGANNILATCYDPSDAAGGVGSAFCNAITRRPDGTIESVLTASQNVASITLKGVDVATSYDFDLFGGLASVNYLGTFTTESDFLPFDGGTTIECAGNFGLDCGEPVPEYKHRAGFLWSQDNLTAQVLWRYVGEVSDDDEGTDYFIESIDATNYFDATVSYGFMENYKVTFGVDNLLDEEPPILGDNQEQANTYPATYDVFGRTYYLSLRADF